MKDVKGNRLFELGLNELSQCAFPSKNEVELQFVEEDTTKTTVCNCNLVHHRRNPLFLFPSSFLREKKTTVS